MTTDMEWRDLARQAEDEAARYRLTSERAQVVADALASATARLQDGDVGTHTVRFDPGKWPAAADYLPPTARDGGQISRQTLFDLAGSRNPAADVALFVTTFIWGYGPVPFGPARFAAICRDTPLDVIGSAVSEARRHLDETGPMAAYDFLRGRAARCRIPGWGPAFYTKLLYAADHRAAGPRRALILDRVIARTVAHLCGMPYLVDSRGRSQRWSAYRYGTYLAWMSHAASQQPLELLEYALFTSRLPHPTASGGR